MKPYKLENERHPKLSLAQEDDLRAAIRKLHPDKEPEFDLALHLGCRRSNLYGQHNGKRKPMEPLQWNDVNLDFRIVTFVRSKNGKRYQVPINDTALAAFKKLRERCDDETGPVMRKPRPRKTNAEGSRLQSWRKWFENCLTEGKMEQREYENGPPTQEPSGETIVRGRDRGKRKEAELAGASMPFQQQFP